jgi:hypothetical protein
LTDRPQPSQPSREVVLARLYADALAERDALRAQIPALEARIEELAAGLIPVVGEDDPQAD